jgi:hypothetical protein
LTKVPGEKTHEGDTADDMDDGKRDFSMLIFLRLLERRSTKVIPRMTWMTGRRISEPATAQFRPRLLRYISHFSLF